MEVSSPMSAAVSLPPSRTAAQPTGVNAPSVTLPLRFMLTGLASLFIGVSWLIARPAMLATYHYNQYVIAVTHLFVLGFLCSVVMGAIYQLVPVALETKLYSERLAKWQFAFHVIGFIGMVWMFRGWNMKQVGHFGSVLTVGVGLFVYNIARTLGRVPKWNVTAFAVAAALAWISTAVLAGLTIATAKCVYESDSGLATAPGVKSVVGGLSALASFMSRFDAISAMHAHAHLGIIGFFLLLIVGVSYKLIPMFTLSEMTCRRRAAWSVALLNLGLAGAFVTILRRTAWKPAFALVIIGGLVLYGMEMRAILRARKRGPLDWGLTSFLTAIALLAPLSGLGLVLSLPGLAPTPFMGQMENVYGFVMLLGVVAFAIVGMLYKIVPFLVWYHCYSKQIGRVKVPALAEMYSPRLQALGFWTYLLALAATTTTTALGSETGVRWSCGLLALSLGVFAVNMGGILAHLIRPRLEPLVLTRAKAGGAL